MGITVPIKCLDEDLGLPAYAYAGDAGLDLRSACDCVLNPYQRMTVPCGFSIAIPEGHCGLVLPRSGLAAKHGISIVNAPGLIDSNYRGEIMVVLINLDTEQPFEIKRGDRIAQLLILQIPTVSLMTVDGLDDTARGEGGFGSSGISSQKLI